MEHRTGLPVSVETILTQLHRGVFSVLHVLSTPVWSNLDVLAHQLQ